MTGGSDGSTIVSSGKQKLCPSKVGMLLFPIKHAHQDIANSVNESPKFLEGACPASFKKMLGVVNFVLDMKITDWNLS